MKLELSLHALKLKNVAGAFKGTSDPFCVVTKIASTPGSRPEVLGKTEVCKNSLSPHWVQVFLLDYELGTPLKIACNVFDEVRKGDNKSMGSAVFEVGELLGARGNTKAKKLKKGGTLYAIVRKAAGAGTLRLQMKGSKLKNVEGMFGKSDPFFELSRRVDTAGGLTWDNVYRSPVVKNNLNPEWEVAVVDLGILCGGDLDLPIQVSVYDHESSGKHVSMGQFETCVSAMVELAKSHDSLTLQRKGKNVGSLTITRAEVAGVQSATEQVTSRLAAASVSAAPAAYVPAAVAPAAAVKSGTPDFADYVSGGCELNVVVAIDFTGSNGDPRNPGTLHYRGSGAYNDYEKAISSILGILQEYDSDQQFPVYGFGAKYGGVVRHCFQCGPAPEVHGVNGVIEAYRHVFSTGLIMSSPTDFSEVIDTAAARATSWFDSARSKGGQSYTILLIVSDGAVTDKNKTAMALQRAGDSPLSVVIVGVGDADFSSMHFLDNSPPGQRDIAQFVEFNRHSQNSVSLTSETLHEIPTQLVGYFQSKGIQPLPPLQRSDSQISIQEEEDEIDLSLDIREDEIVVTGGGGFVDGFGR